MPGKRLGVSYADLSKTAKERWEKDGGKLEYEIEAEEIAKSRGWVDVEGEGYCSC